MATTANLSSIIRFYAEKQKSPFIDFREFCTYVKKYAEHHVEEQGELVKYLGDPSNTVSAELAGLEEKHLASVITNGAKKTIVSISYFSLKFANQYKEILKNDSINYPLESDLPKRFPTPIIEKKAADDYIINSIEKTNPKSPILYILVFARDIPTLLLPACVPVKLLIETAQLKIRKALKKDEFHDYILKKLRSANPAKEISIKNFFTHFVDRDYEGYLNVSDGDDYYLWNQLCYFLRQDFEKIQDKTLEDINILQAIAISEIHSSYLKQKMQTDKKREEALKELAVNLGEYPYFFTINQILKFHDKNGKLLYGQYSEDDLKDFLSTNTTDLEDNQLPKLLVFKVASGNKYYVYKSKVPQLVIRLCNEAHDSVKKSLTTKWYNRLYNFEKIPEMYDDVKFEDCLEEQIELSSPVLYSLLNANFMALLSYDIKPDNLDNFQLFVDGKLLPYSDLLMLKKEQILSDAKIQLPFYYSIPIINWIVSLFHNRKKQKSTKNEVQKSIVDSETKENPKTAKSKEETLALMAKDIANEFIPEGSTVDRELDFLNKQWNKRITTDANRALTEDVNALIRDYTRKILRTLSAQTFTKERVENLAESLVNTPIMKKIGEEKFLTEYVALYMIRLISNNPKNPKIN